MELDADLPLDDPDARTRGPSTPDTRRRRNRTLTDEQFVQMLERRTGRSHDHWFALLVRARAARASTTCPGDDP
jgi:hypothetical protein